MRHEKRNLSIVVPTAYVMGGVQSWLDYLVPGLESRGWNVTMLLVHGASSDAYNYLAMHPFKKYKLVVNQTGSREGRIRALKKAIQLADSDVVLNVNIVDTYEAVARIRRTTKSGLKVVMALHGLNAAFYDDIARYSNLLDGVIATNRLAVAAAGQISGLSRDLAFYAPCGVDISEYVDSEISGNSIELLYSGRFDEKEKRVLDLPKILAALDQKGISYRLQLAGAGPDENKLRAAVEPFGGRVEFLGVLDAETLGSSFYRHDRILLILSPSETGPIVAWEAMSKGVIVATSQFTGIGLEESLVDGKTCVSFPVGDIQAAADAIASLQDAGLRKSLATAGHELVLERYSRSGSVTSWDKALRHIQEQPDMIAEYIPDKSFSSGRLDQYLGVSVAETIRQLLGVRFEHKAPGDEWPHSYGNDDNDEFRQKISQLDRGAGC